MIEAAAVLFTVAVLAVVAAEGLRRLLADPPHDRPEHAHRCDRCHCTYRSSACLARHHGAQHPTLPEPPP